MAPPWEYFGKPDHSLPDKDISESTISSGKQEKAAANRRAKDVLCRGPRLRIGLGQRRDGQSVFQLSGAKGMPTIESNAFPSIGAPESPGLVAMAKEFHAFVSRLAKDGWHQCGRGRKWYAYDMVKERR